MYNISNYIFLALFCFIINANIGYAQPQDWNAQWITSDAENEDKEGLYLFRKMISISEVPNDFRVNISADNKYKLYVNEQLVSVGPAWGDIKNWNYETVDLAPFLKQGDNIIAAKVWNEGSLRPVAQFSWKTAFIIQGVEESSNIINSDTSWKSMKDESYTPFRQSVRGYYAAGAGDFIDFNHSDPNWNKSTFNDSSWKNARTVFETETRGFGFRARDGWNLVPSILPAFEISEERLAKVRKSDGLSIPSSFLTSPTSVNIPANSTHKILLDQGHLTNAYFSLLMSGGKNSGVSIVYAEGLYDEEGAKGNRNDIEGKSISGRKDSLISNGQDNQLFTSLSYRTYRFVELQIETKDEALTINDVYGHFTGYPFEFNATVETNDQELKDILEIGWRTARLCAVDTYMDCPYYERLQYVGDTRIQHFISFYNSGDDRLAKNTINLLDQSRQPDGYTLSRYPDRQNQVIPTYALWYVSMLYDYMMYGKDPEFVKSKILGSRQVLNYFITYLRSDGSLKNVPGWNYTDWVPEWRFGMAPSAEDGSSALLDLQMLHAIQSGIALEEYAGRSEFVKLYSEIEEQLINTIKRKYWDESRGLYADTPNKDVFSQHANSLAILAGIVDDNDLKNIGQQMLADTSLAPASIYFKYYLHLALNEAGFGDQYLDWLDIWRKNIELGLTTWGETSQVETTRSDCHAWGSSPNIELYRIIMGIQSDAPNFKKVKIEPQLGDINKIAGTMPHPDGTISLDYSRSGNELIATITLPENITGTFIWNGKEIALKGGENKIGF